MVGAIEQAPSLILLDLRVDRLPFLLTPAVSL
jgi:hypothetical protein